MRPRPHPPGTASSRAAGPRRHGRTVGAVSAAAALLTLLGAAGSADAAPPGDGPRAPLVDAPSGAVRGRYIVVLRDARADRGTPSSALPSAPAAQRARKRGVAVHTEYHHALAAFAATLDAAQLDAVRRDPDVAYVEPDAEMHATTDTTQPNATWGLDRVDARTGLDGTYTYSTNGAGVTVFVIDTGILAGHREFGRRVAKGVSFVKDRQGTTDCNGHGTHVAGTVGGTTYGVAKGVSLVPVRVLDCRGSGTTSGVISGVDWVARQSTGGPKVANMSLGGGPSPALNAAVAASITAGVTYAVAAGNDGKDACGYSPASVPAALTVGATTTTTTPPTTIDTRASYSNVGSCLDLFAPGTGITSAGITSTTATATMSGTSMASPHVAGVAALYLAAHSDATPAIVAAAVTGAATAGVVLDAGLPSKTPLLYSRLS